MVFGENNSRRLSNFLQTHIFWKIDHISRTYNQINYRNIWFAKVKTILIMMAQVPFFDIFFSKKTRTLMPLRLTQMTLAISQWMGYLPLIQKNSITHMYGLAVYVKEGLPFARNLSLHVFPYVSDWLYVAQCLTSFTSINKFLSLCIVFYSISLNIDEILLINPSAVCLWTL